jgi:hypothetical protein
MATRISSREMSTVWSLRRAGCIPPLSADVVEGVVTTAVEEPPGEATPVDGARHWREGNSPRSVAPETGGVQTAPDCIQTFKPSNHALFADDLRDIVGPLGRSASRCRSPGLPKKETRRTIAIGTTTLVRRPKSVIRVRDIADHNLPPGPQPRLDPLPPGISLGATQHSPTGLLAPAAQG